MVVSHAVNSDSFTVTTPSDQEIRMTRLFSAPRHLVFEAMTKPEHVTQWWGRLGDAYSVPVCEIDLRVGGRWRFVNRHPQGEAAFHGEYREIAPPDRLVFTEIFEEFPDVVTVVTAEFVEEAPSDDLHEWVHAARLRARRAGLQRGPWRMSGRLGRRARA